MLCQEKSGNPGSQLSEQRKRFCFVKSERQNFLPKSLATTWPELPDGTFSNQKSQFG
jgi:hypothetical protein